MSYTPYVYMEGLCIRPSVIFIEDGKVLCVDTVSGGKRHMVFPGGGLEKSETLQEAAIREVREEVGFDCDILKLAYVQDLIFDRATNKRVIDFIFIGKRTSDIKYKTIDDNGKILHVKWLTFSEFVASDFLPTTIKLRLEKDYLAGFPNVVYLEEVVR